MATTNNLQLSASSSYSSLPTWDVFLSFYGKDTRRNFTSHLYSALVQAGIKTFMDEPELQKGANISPGLSKAICGSNIFIVVLSENYAFSRWCLNELVEILTCKRTNGQVVIPVFYYVDPSDIRHQRKSFGEGLESQQNSHSVDVIDKWKSALAEIAELSGYHLKKDADENESDTIQEIVENMAPLISTKMLHLEEYLVGIDSSVEEIYQKLSMGTNDIRALGICGMGGIGKTTAAKAFYNKYFNNFDISCFIDDVKQHSQGGSPLLPLLQQLSVKLLGRKEYKVHDVKSGIRQLKQILCTRKALIVLDDLDQSSYSELLVRLCNLFSAGSRIIFTTRNANLVNQLKEDMSDVDIYMMRELKQIDSLDLFSYHAFRKPTPPEIFEELTKSFVTYAGGLPLALKVLGSSLLGRTHVSYWKTKLIKVQEIVERDIQRILQLSYDELSDETEKAIFLDIAFFFIGEEKNEAIHIFNSCGFFPDVGIPVLVEKCLLTIDENNMFQMHNLIQDMGREVMREESKHGNCTRLHLCQANACVALQNLEGTEKIEGLIIDQTISRKRQFSAEIFERLPNLRLLEIIGAHDIVGNLENSFHELRSIRWRHCPWKRLPSSFRPQKLVSLSMPYSKFKTLWKGNTPSVNLKTINLSYSRDLKTTPDFRDAQLIEKLLFLGCEGMLEVHPSIGQLTNLSHLDLGKCKKLTELPEPIRHLTSLGHLDLRGCLNLQRLPEPIKQLTNLCSLYLSDCCNLKRLPHQLGDMKGLKMLDASYTLIEELPDSIVHLKGLVELNLISCKKLRKLPEQFGKMESLKRFDASHSAIEQLPDTFAGLINMVNLHLRWCENLTSLPNTIWKLKFLQVLDLEGSVKLKQLPEQLGKMQCLETLIASFTAIKEMPDSIELLSRLQVLDIKCCNNIVKNVPTKVYLRQEDRINVPATVKNMKLKRLSLRCNISSWLPVILSLSSLEMLTLCDEGQNLSSIEPFSLYKLSNLQDLTLHNCTSHECSFPELPQNLTSLCILDYAKLKMLPDLSNLKQLKSLYISRGISFESFPPLPPDLQRLIIWECPSLQDLPDLSMLKELRELNVWKCINLKSISLKQSSLQVISNTGLLFRADIPNREIAEWFSYKSSRCTLSFVIPPTLGENFFGIALWVVFKLKGASRCSLHMKPVITNKTKGTEKKYPIYVNHMAGEIQSKIQCISGGDLSVKSGDIMTVTFPSLYYSGYVSDNYVRGEVKVKMCGAHLILKTPSPSC